MMSETEVGSSDGQIRHHKIRIFGMKRVHWHWTAGAPGMIGVEADSYHSVIQPDGTVQPGTWPSAADC